MAKRRDFSWTLGTPAHLIAWIDRSGGWDGDLLRVCINGTSTDRDGRLQLEQAWECRAVAEWLMKAAGVLEQDAKRKQHSRRRGAGG